MVLGSAEMDDAGSAAIAEQHQCVVISVDYRLAPENPYPAPLHDCYAALKWFAKNANSLGVSSDRIAIWRSISRWWTCRWNSVNGKG